MNDNLKKILVVIALMLLSAAGGRFLAPSKVEEKEVIKYVEKIVEKKIYVKDTKQAKRRVYIKLVTIKPDGTKTTETKIFDSDQIEITQKENSTTTVEKNVDSNKEKVVEYSKNDYYIFGSAKIDVNDLSSTLAYGLSINRRLLGPTYIGVFGYTDSTAGFNLGLGF